MSKQLATILKAQYILLKHRADLDADYAVNDEKYFLFLMRVIETYGMPMARILDLAA